MNEALWALGRGTGVVALLMFTLTLVLGIVSRSRAARRRARPVRAQRGAPHRRADRRRPDRRARRLAVLRPLRPAQLVDLVLPFLGSYRPFWLGLGTLAVDLLAVITVVSLLRNTVGPRVFRAVHWLTYALWPVALLHALGNGTDAGSLWMDAVAVVCCGRRRRRGRLAPAPVVRRARPCPRSRGW